MQRFADAVRRTGVRILLLVCAVWVSVPPGVGAQEVEEILAYDVSITVEPGGAMDVTEVLRVRALGEQIRRGIFRDFPTGFPRAAGLGRIEAPFDVVSVLRDGSPEPFRVEAIGGEFGRSGMRVRVGDANVLLQSGVYEYTIHYRTDRWVRFGEVEDQLYWNVTGNGWAFPIRSASAEIRIPELSSAPRLESWTGPEGSTDNAATAAWDASARTATFTSRQNLSMGSGMTVRVAFPSGQLTPPTEEQQAAWFRLDWGGYVDAGSHSKSRADQFSSGARKTRSGSAVKVSSCCHPRNVFDRSRSLEALLGSTPLTHCESRVISWFHSRISRSNTWLYWTQVAGGIY